MKRSNPHYLGAAGLYLVQPAQMRKVFMEKNTPEKIVASASVNMHGQDARIEKLSTAESGKENIRISAHKQGTVHAEALTLSEEQLIELLHKASHAGVLSPGFIGKLREKIEI
jgi:hypothetical protein